MKLKFYICFFLLGAGFNISAQVIRPFAVRYYNPSVRGNIVYVSNSIISTAGIGSGSPGTGEVPPAGTTKDNAGAAINIDVDGAGTAPTTLIAYGSQWYFHDTVTTAVIGTGRLNNWNQTSYNDTWWRQGNAVIYYNDAGTTLANNPGNATYPTTYFRKTINIPSVSAYSDFTINLRRDDGAIVYVNGVKVFADVFFASPTTYLTPAVPATNIEGANEYKIIQIPASKFVSGNNTIAVEVHNQTNTSTSNIRDMLFDFELLGNYLNTTFNSSTADLNLPSCSQILWAGLYWGADQGTYGTDSSWITGDADKTIKFKIPGGSYQVLTSQQSNQHSLGWSTAGFNHTGYLCFADITSLLNTTNPNGTYSGANVLGPIGIVNGCGGWTIAIAYANSSLQLRNLTVFDGAVIINLGDPAVDVPISGFLTPPSGAVSCELGAVVYDGDRSSTDSFAFKQNGAASFYNLATTTIPLNGNNDAWNSKISYKGSVVTTRNPAFQNTLGYDAPIFDLPNTSNLQLSNNQTAANIRFASPSENYFVHVLSTSISQYNPTYSFDKTATDINGGSLLPGDSLRYQINFTNLGNDSSINSTILDNIPAGTTFIPGSIKISAITKTDATGDDQADYDFTNNRVVFRVGLGADASTGGRIGIGVSGNVQFDVVVGSSCTLIGCTVSIRNSARINYTGKTSGSVLFDSSGVNSSGCITPGPVVNVVAGTCYTPGDTLVTNNCPATSVLLPWRKYGGYTFYSGMPFIPGNIYDPYIPITVSHTYWAYFDSGVGCSDTIKINVFIVGCPDIDDDNDGLPDYVELNDPVALQDADSDGILNWNDNTYAGFVDNNSDGFNDNFDPSADSDNDGIPNFYDINFPGYVDSNNDGVNDNLDKDLDGIPNHLDLDSDNDGIPDTVESFGVDANGDGCIDNYTDTDNDGFSQNVDFNNTGVANSGVGLGAVDTDGDGIANYLDLDSDNDGIPDIIEVFGTDASNSAKVSVFTDIDGDGYADALDADVGNDNVAENTAASLLLTSADGNNDGRCDTWPNKNMESDSKPNPYDLDSDGDGITDTKEAQFTDANWDGQVDGAINADGRNAALAAQGSLTFPDTDGNQKSNPYDIDSDDDGIPDNVEGMTTNGYLLPAAADTDLDGIDDTYDNFNGFGGDGIHPPDKDADTQPDYLDSDTDGDGLIDIVEGNDLNLNGLPDDNVTLTGTDTDGDGLDDRFDNNNSSAEATSARMGNGGSTSGDPTPGSITTVQQTAVAAGLGCTTERDWRCIFYVLSCDIITFKAVLQNQQVKLDWTVLCKQEADNFTVQRSTDKTTFNDIVTLSGRSVVNEMESYSATDDITGVNDEIIYYRLKTLLKNGKTGLSNIIAVRRITNYKTDLQIFPNPVKGQMQLLVNSTTQVTAEFALTDGNGKFVQRFIEKILPGSNNITNNIVSNLSSGIYFLRMTAGDQVIIKKINIIN
ncbi:MAG: T9SS type A sorting domain-containing protein [Chitinophagaceae bacterium]|nr:T9SS type A sorting domain-containing protein [Chitinophagaceae bacterium]